MTAPDGSTFYSGSATASGGVASFNLSGSVIKTAGSYTFTATSAGLSSVSQTITVNAAVLQIGASGSGGATVTITVSRGGSGVGLSVASSAGQFVVSSQGLVSGTVTLACSGLPAGLGCALSPSSFAGSQLPATVTLTVTSTTLNAGIHSRRTPAGWALAMMLPGMLLVPAGLRSRKRGRLALTILFGVLLALSLSACGGSAHSSTVAAGSYTGTLTATTNGSTASAHFKVVVQ